ncbi:hypothetical protein FQ192_07350 [Pseudomonas sp. ANT_J12]|nr:hypothetical protein FQ192_07350 [Pseudomonas sp. ANT_J12]
MGSHFITDALGQPAWQQACSGFQSNADLWRGSLLPLGCEAVVTPANAVCQTAGIGRFGAAARPSGSKLPRHRVRCIAFSAAESC